MLQLAVFGLYREDIFPVGIKALYVIPAFIASLTYLALTIFVYLRVAQRTPAVKRFTLTWLAFSVYSSAIMMQFIMFRENAPPPRGLLIFMHISNTMGAFIPPIYADFLLSFAKRRPRWYWGIYGIIAVTVPIFIRHERIHELRVGKFHYYPPPFIVGPLLSCLFFVLVTWGLVSLRRAYRDADSPIQRKTLRALFWASFVVVPATVSDFAFMSRNKGIFPFSTVACLGYIVYFSYAIVKYRFLGIQVAIRKSIAYIALTVPITTFFLVGAMISYNFTPFGVESTALTILWALLAAIVFYVIREKLEVFIDRVMFKKSYQYQLSLERLDQEIMNEVDPASFVLKLARWLEDSLKLKNVDVFLLETQIGKEEQYFTTVRADEKTEAKRISGDSLLVRSLREEQETIFRADLPVLPQFRNVYSALDKEFQMLSAEICVPLVTDRLLFGIDPNFQRELTSGSISERLRQEFENNGISLFPNVNCLAKERHRKWLISDKNNTQTYVVRKEEEKLNVYAGSKLSGIIVCGSKRSGRFEEEDRRLLGIAAHNTAFAVERAQLILELKSANQFKWDLVRWMSHDLNTPLTPIKMIVGALRNKMDNSEEDQQAISVVMGEITRLQSLINSLDFIADMDVVSNRNPIKREPMDLGKLIAEVATLFESQARESGITLSCRISPDIDPLNGDANRMKQVWVNLISNSIKYNRPGGKVEITAAQSDGSVVANIVDTGIGIPEAEEASIFEPFYRGDKAQDMGKGGVGLGLAIVKRIVEEHGGTIQVQSELDVGTSISLTIPCDQKDMQYQESAGGEELWQQKEAS